MADRQIQSEPPAWQRHEDYVAALYKRMGFAVTQNVNVDGQQVDMICEKQIAGIGRTQLCIDCKHTHLAENRSVSKDDVDQFIFTFRNRAESNGWTAGVLVSNRPFSQYAKAAAAKYKNVHLKTVDELHEEILHIGSYLHDSLRHYDEVNRFFDFVPPYGYYDKAQTDENILLGSLIKQWLDDPNTQQLCLFGDFGTGKTTFLEFLHYTFARKYLSDPSARIPLLVPLRRYYEASDHEEMITQFFLQECGASIQYSLFHEFLVKGRLLLLLDGFDEMGAKSDPKIRKMNYLKLAPLVCNASKVLISCRPAYFLSLDETHSVFSFVNKQIGFAPPLKEGPISEHLYQIVQDADLKSLFAKTRTALNQSRYAYIGLFDKKQIKAYLRKHNETIITASGGQMDCRGLFQRMHEIYDLEDLAQRPILLKLIVNTLPLFRAAAANGYEITVGDKNLKVSDITPSVLYAVYTEKELEREYKKGKIRWLIDRQDKVRVIATIAFEMFRNDVVALDKTALAQIVQRIFPDNDEEQAYYLTDIRACSFLNRDTQDSVRFTHKSFMEYYAAVYIRMNISGAAEAQDLLSMRILSDEVAFFLGDIIAASPSPMAGINPLIQLYDRLSNVESPLETCMQNLINVLNYARYPISPIRNLKIGLIVYKKLDLKGQIIEKLSVDVLRTVKLRAVDWTMDATQVKRWESESSHISELNARELDVKTLRFWNTQIDECTIDQSSLVIDTWRVSRIRRAVFRDVVISADRLVGKEWLPEEGTFEDCILVGLDLRAESFYKLKLTRCTLVMCRADDAPVRQISLEQCRGVLIKDGDAGLRDWGCGLTSCGIEYARDVRRKDIGKSPAWQDLVIRAFEAEVQKFPKSSNEIKVRLREVDLASQLMRNLGKTAVISGGNFSDNDRYRITKCDLKAVTFFNLRTEERFDESLRRISIESKHGEKLHISVR